jgi:hypothetical protein
VDHQVTQDASLFFSDDKNKRNQQSKKDQESEKDLAVKRV